MVIRYRQDMPAEFVQWSTPLESLAQSAPEPAETWLPSHMHEGTDTSHVAVPHLLRTIAQTLRALWPSDKWSGMPTAVHFVGASAGTRILLDVAWYLESLSLGLPVHSLRSNDVELFKSFYVSYLSIATAASPLS